MTILEMISELLKLHGVEKSFDRIDLALNELYKVEMGEKTPKKSEVKETQKFKKEVVEEKEHIGI